MHARPLVKALQGVAFAPSLPLAATARAAAVAAVRGTLAVGRVAAVGAHRRAAHAMSAGGARAVATAPVYNAREHVLVAPRVSGVRVVSGGAITDAEGELLVVAVWGRKKSEKKEGGDDGESVGVLPEELAGLDGELGGALLEAVGDAGFDGEAGSCTEVVRVAGGRVKRVVLHGLGGGGEAGWQVRVGEAAAFAVAKAGAVRACQGKGGRVFFAVVGEGAGVGEADVVAKIVDGAQVAGYVDERYVKGGREGKKAGKVVGEVVVLGVGDGRNGTFEEGVRRGTALAAGVVTTKEVVAAPANFLNPRTMAEAAQIVAQEEGMECKVLGREECRALGMGSFLGVAQGDPCEPQFIHMVYRPEGGARRRVAIVGKSVCHDTGGYNLKAGPGSMIELMKWDMGGGGTTLGAARAVGMLKPPGVEVHFILPAVMNLVSAEAYLPGDILTAANGKTIEVLNTDAEGRLCLCDALIYAEKVVGGMDAMVDVATLTGACIVALGNGLAGMWSPSDALAERLLAAAAGTEDKMWRMPLPEEYVEGLKSKIADWRNIGAGRAGGSITAALFLKQFVEMDEWAHLDIAGTAWSDKKSGATGWGVRTLTNWVESYSADP